MSSDKHFKGSDRVGGQKGGKKTPNIFQHALEWRTRRKAARHKARGAARRRVRILATFGLLRPICSLHTCNETTHPELGIHSGGFGFSLCPLTPGQLVHYPKKMVIEDRKYDVKTLTSKIPDQITEAIIAGMQLARQIRQRYEKHIKIISHFQALYGVLSPKDKSSFGSPITRFARVWGPGDWGLG